MKSMALIVLAVIVLATPVLGGEDPLDKRRSLDFREASLGEALRLLSQIAQLHVILDPAAGTADRPITLKVADVTVGDALSVLTSLVGLSYDRRWGGVFVASKKRLAELPVDALVAPKPGREAPEDRALHARLSEENVSFSFEMTPVPQVLEYIRSVVEMNVILDRAIQSEVEEMAFTGKVTEATVKDALLLLLVPRGLVPEIRSGVVFVRKAGPRPKREKPAEKKDLPKILLEKTMSIRMEDVPLANVAAVIQVHLGYPIRVDPDVYSGRPEGEPKVTVNTIREVPAKTVLDLVAEVSGLGWDIRWGGVFLARSERLAALPKTVLPEKPSAETAEWEVKLRARLAGETSACDFKGVDLTTALAHLRDELTLNILLDPIAAKAAASTRVTLGEKKALPIGDLLSLLLIPRGYEYELAHEVIIVRTAHGKALGTRSR